MTLKDIIDAYPVTANAELYLAKSIKTTKLIPAVEFRIEGALDKPRLVLIVGQQGKE